MRINCVNLQRRLPRRSVCLERAVVLPPGLLVLVIWSYEDAMEACLSRVKPNSPSEYKIAGIPGKTYSVTVLGKK